MIQKTFRIFLWSMASVVVLLAVALSAARLLLPAMSEYRTQIELLVTSTVGQPVSIGSLDASWHGLSPVLELHDVLIQTPHLPGGHLSLDKIQVALDVAASVLTRSWKTSGVRIIGVELEVHTDLRSGEQLIDLRAVLRWLVRQRSISLENIQLNWRDQGLFEVPLRLSNLTARLQNSGDQHQFLIHSELPVSLGKSVTFSADLSGPSSRVSTWNGKLYARTEGLELTDFWPAMADAGLIAHGAVDVELWAGLDAGLLEWGNGSLVWQQPLLRNTSADAQQVSADSLRAAFHWREWQGGWRAGIEDFELTRNGDSVWPSSQMAMDISSSDPLRIQGQASTLVLDELYAILPLIPWVDDDALSMLDRLQPQGVMRDAEFNFNYRPGKVPGFAVRSRIEDLSLAANGGLPGVQGLSGVIEGNLQAGQLTLDSQQAQLILPRLFPQPLALDSLAGTLHWQRYQDMFRLETQRLSVASGPLAMNSRWQMDWSYDQAAPWLDLQLAADELPLIAVQEFLPSGVMSPRAVDWLEQAFLSGSASNIQVMLQGRLDQMPFDDGQGIFEARFDFDDAILDYHPTWGQLDELDGHAVFRGRSMRITGDRAHILESPVKAVVATIENLKKPVLTVEGTVAGTLEAMLDFVQSSPLQTNFGALVDQLSSSGDAHLQLNLSIPLRKELGAISLSGDVLMSGNALRLKGRDIDLTDIDGTLNFTQEGIRVDQASARLWGRPVKVSVYKQGIEGRSQSVVDISGRFGLSDYLQQSMLSDYLSGRAHWRARLDIQNQTSKNVPRVQLRVESDLKGIRSTLPAPFNKQADESRELEIRWVPGGNLDHPVEIVYADVIRAEFALDEASGQLRRAAVVFGGRSARLPSDDIFNLSGELSVFDLGQWLPILTQLGNDEGGLHPVIDIKADLFRYAGFQVTSVKASTKQADPWHFLVDGENSKGWLRWVPAMRVLPARLLMNFDSMNVQDLQSSASDERPDTAISPADVPELEIEIGSLHLDNKDLGAVNLYSRRVLHGVSFERFAIDSPAIVLNGSGAWLEQANGQVSRFNVEVTGGDLGKLATLLDTGNEVEGGELSGDVSVSWAGAPMDFELAHVEADIQLKAKDGRLVSVDEGPGKLLSLFSLNSLQRRLSLDFSDVVKEGFSFDTMKGNFVIMDGDAFTNDFTIKGTSVRIDIAGRTGLSKRDYDQLVTVTPQVTSTLPLAGAIAGGPVIGAAVFLADKLVGDQFNRLTRVQYQVTGSWDKPVYQRLSEQPAKKRGSSEQPSMEDID